MVQDQAKEYVTRIIEGIIDHPETLTIEDRVDASGLTLTITCQKDEMRFLVGREGQVANSIRKVMEMWGRKHKAKVNIYFP